MEAKFTPGPWQAFELAPEDPSWGACEIWPESAVAERHDDDSDAGPVATMVMGTANARLIAAAPRMYAYIKSRSDEGDLDASQILEDINASF